LLGLAWFEKFTVSRMMQSTLGLNGNFRGLLTRCLPGNSDIMRGPISRLTKRSIDALKPPAGGHDAVLFDDALPGFGVRVKPSGVISYLVQFRNRKGRSRRLTLGRHGVLTPDEARRETRKVLADVAKGADPAEARVEARRDLNVRALCDLYLAEGLVVRFIEFAMNV
jgi:hypothetical protein